MMEESLIEEYRRFTFACKSRQGNFTPASLTSINGKTTDASSWQAPDIQEGEVGLRT